MSGVHTRIPRAFCPTFDQKIALKPTAAFGKQSGQVQTTKDDSTVFRNDGHDYIPESQSDYLALNITNVYQSYERGHLKAVVKKHTNSYKHTHTQSHKLIPC